MRGVVRDVEHAGDDLRQDHEQHKPEKWPGHDPRHDSCRWRQRSLGLAHLSATFELLGELVAGGEAVGGIGGEAAADRLFERLASAGHRDLRAGWPLSAPVGQLAEPIDHAQARIERELQISAIEQFIEHQSERIDVGLLGDGVFGGVVGGVERVEVLGGHVGDRAAEHFFAFTGRLLRRDVEVGEHRPAVGAHEDVGWLDVAVQHATLVGEVERLAQPGANPGGGLDGVHLAHRLAIAERRGSSAVGIVAFVSMIASTSLPRQVGGEEFSTAGAVSSDAGRSFAGQSSR